MFTYIGPYARVEGTELRVVSSLGLIMPTLKSVNGSSRFISIFIYSTFTAWIPRNKNCIGLFRTPGSFIFP